MVIITFSSCTLNSYAYINKIVVICNSYTVSVHTIFKNVKII